MELPGNKDIKGLEPQFVEGEGAAAEEVASEDAAT